MHTLAPVFARLLLHSYISSPVAKMDFFVTHMVTSLWCLGNVIRKIEGISLINSKTLTHSWQSNWHDITCLQELRRTLCKEGFLILWKYVLFHWVMLVAYTKDSQSSSLAWSYKKSNCMRGWTCLQGSKGNVGIWSVLLFYNFLGWLQIRFIGKRQVYWSIQLKL